MLKPRFLHLFQIFNIFVRCNTYVKKNIGISNFKECKKSSFNLFFTNEILYSFYIFFKCHKTKKSFFAIRV